jgi:hypothetical protein
MQNSYRFGDFLFVFLVRASQSVVFSDQEKKTEADH